MFRCFALLCAASLSLLGACSEDETTKPSRFALSEEYASLPAEGGEVAVYYSLEKPLYDASLRVECDADWITEFDTSVSGVITFRVEASTDPSPRETTLRISYSSAAQGGTFRVEQAAYVEPEFFTFTVLDRTYTSVAFDVIPADKELTYVTLLVEKEIFDEFDSDEAYFQDDLEFLRNEAAAYGLTLTEYLSQALRTGDTKGRTVSGLLPGTDYYIYAYGLSPDGERLSDIYKTQVTTLAIEKVDARFAIDCSVNGPYVDMRITPEDPEQAYITAVYPRSSAASAADVVRLYQNYLNEKIAEGEINGKSVAEVMNELSVKGTVVRNYKMEKNTDYIGFAAAVNNSGLIISDATVEEFRSGDAIQASDNDITLSVSDITGRSAAYSVTTTNDDPYVFFCLESAELSGMSDEELLAYFVGSGDLTSMAGRGDDAGIINGLSPLTDYSLFAFGYLGGQATTKLIRRDFSTTEAVLSDATIEILYDKYYDGTEAALYFPDLYSEAVGLAVFPIKVVATGDIKRYYYHIFMGDLTDADEYPDEEIIAELMKESYYYPAMDFFLPFDKPSTILAVAEDSDGNLGALFRAAVCLSKEGVSPIEELTAGLSAATAPTTKYSGTTVFEGLRTMDAADLLPNFDRPRILRTADAVPQPTTRRCVML